MKLIGSSRRKLEEDITMDNKEIGVNVRKSTDTTQNRAYEGRL